MPAMWHEAIATAIVATAEGHVVKLFTLAQVVSSRERSYRHKSNGRWAASHIGAAAHCQDVCGLV